MDTNCILAWGKNGGKVIIGGLSMFGGAALCTSGLGCLAGGIGIVTGGSNVYEGVDWFANGTAESSGVNPVKRAITNYFPGSNADLAFASLEVLGGGLALKAPVLLKTEMWITNWGIQHTAGLPMRVQFSQQPAATFDAAGAAWDGVNAAIDQAKKK
jgi:hypothetical protein